MPPSASPPRPADSRWWAHAFGRVYLTIYGHRDEAEARRNAPQLLRLLGAPWNARVLDVACGEGRYARALQGLGCRVTGVDLSAELLEEARRKSPDLPGTPTYVRGDIRDLPFVRQFEAAISMFTSIGYFESPQDDLRVFEGVRRALVPGGRFLVDFLNATEVRASLVPESFEERPPYRIEIRRRIDEGAHRTPSVRKSIRVVDTRTDSVESEVEERVRLYEPHEIEALLVDAGLDPVGERHGGLDGRPFHASSPRLVRVARRSTAPRAARPATAAAPFAAA
jgi:SAM-dependent methyltransferase